VSLKLRVATIISKYRGEEPVDVTTYLGHRIELPARRHWSRSATAKFLKSQGFVGSDVDTLDYWEWEKKLWRGIPEFRALIPLDPVTKKYKRGYWFKPYQFFVVVKTAYLVTLIRDDLMGCAYLDEVAKTLEKKEVQRKYLSPEIWKYEQFAA
jgi:hypothetical protein